MLMLGVILVQWPNDNHGSSSIQMNENRLIGLISIILSSLSSGFSGVYFEKLIKVSKSQSLWIRNLQLAILSCLFASFTIIVYDFNEINLKGFFYVSITIVMKYFLIKNRFDLLDYIIHIQDLNNEILE
mgnify:CR=1 FL=1